MYTHALTGIAGAFSASTLDFIFSHPHVSHVDADCVVTLDDPVDDEDERVDSETGRIKEGMAKALGHPEGMVRAATTQSDPVWGLDRIDDEENTDDDTFIYPSGMDGSGTVIYGALSPSRQSLAPRHRYPSAHPDLRPPCSPVSGQARDRRPSRAHSARYRHPHHPQRLWRPCKGRVLVGLPRP